MNWNSFRNFWRKPWSPYRAAFVGAVSFLVLPTLSVAWLKFHGLIGLLTSPAFGVRTAYGGNAAEILFTAPPLIGGITGFLIWALVRGIWRSRLPRGGRILVTIGTAIASLAAGLFLVGVALSCWLDYEYGVPSDARLLADFRRHEPALERLRAMLDKLPEPGRIDAFGSEDYSAPRPASAAKSQEIARYRASLAAAGVVQCSGGRDSAEFPVWLEGWMIADGEEKGFYYLKTPPKPLRSSLNGIVIPYSVTYYGYRHITGNWYLYYCHTAG